MRAYNLSIAEYEMLVASQNGRCAICGILGSDTPKGLVVDHKKGTKEVRGLLCNVCNSHVVHVVEDYGDRLEAAKVYLERNK
jgi:Zn finger protein HypA/HybF involved in hydrogenase expression